MDHALIAAEALSRQDSYQQTRDNVIVGVSNMCADEITRVAFVAAANGVDHAVMLAQAVRSAQRGHRQEVEPDAFAEVTQVFGEDRFL